MVQKESAAADADVVQEKSKKTHTEFFLCIVEWTASASPMQI